MNTLHARPRAAAMALSSIALVLALGGCDRLSTPTPEASPPPRDTAPAPEPVPPSPPASPASPASQ